MLSNWVMQLVPKKIVKYFPEFFLDTKDIMGVKILDGYIQATRIGRSSLV